MADKTALDIELQDSNGNAVVSDKLEVTNQSVITSSVTVETELVPDETGSASRQRVCFRRAGGGL